MTRSKTPGTAAGTPDSNEDYSPSAEPDDALATDSLDDDLAGDALMPQAARMVASRPVDEAPRIAQVPDDMAGDRLNTYAELFTPAP